MAKPKSPIYVVGIFYRTRGCVGSSSMRRLGMLEFYAVRKLFYSEMSTRSTKHVICMNHIFLFSI